MPSGLFYLELFGPFHFQHKRFLVYFYYCLFYFFVVNANSVEQLRRRVLWLLSWVYTVCQCPFYGPRGINGFRVQSVRTKSSLKASPVHQLVSYYFHLKCLTFSTLAYFPCPGHWAPVASRCAVSPNGWFYEVVYKSNQKRLWHCLPDRTTLCSHQ